MSRQPIYDNRGKLVGHRYDFDSSGQVDGDDSGSVRFQSQLGAVGTPWAREGTPPWHMWGNTQTQEAVQSGGSLVASAPSISQLVRVSYRRPESWHWLLQTRLITAPTPPIPAAFVNVDVHFDLTIGIGRAMTIIPDFDVHSWHIENPQVPPLDANQAGNVLRTTTAIGNRLYNLGSGGVLVTDPSVISQFVAQDIQLQARLVLTTSSGGTLSASVEVSGLLAPMTHIRPDWYQDDRRNSPEAVFPGNETGGT